MEELRVKAFRTLKPPCVEVSQLALKYRTKSTTSQELIKSMQNLLDMLQDHELFLDEKLADYVFFPLSHVFRDAKEMPVSVLEIALGCLRILISRGWRREMSPEMSKQLIILLCFLAGGDPSQPKVKTVNEELGTAAFETLSTVAKGSQNMGLGDEGSIPAESFPTLGHAVSVMIDGFTDGPSVKVRMAAITALENTTHSMTDKDALKNVFPGIVSSLTKVLSGKGKLRSSLKVLVAGLNALEYTLQAVLGGIADGPGKTTNSEVDDNRKSKWLEATGHQVQLALANIMPLRYHDRLEVQKALAQLCISVITSCQKTLPQSVPMLVESLIVLSGSSREDGSIKASFHRLLQTDPTLIDTINTSFHDWIQALPRTMQSNDDTRRRRNIDQVATAYSIVKNTGLNADLMNESFTFNLHACITAAIQDSPKQIVQPSSQETTGMTKSLHLARGTPHSTTFSPVLFRESGMETTRHGLTHLVDQLKDNPSSGSLGQHILTSLRSSNGNEQLASLWLSLHIISQEASNSLLLDQYLDSNAIQHSAFLLDEVYAFALSALSRSTFDSDDSTWCLQALSLEVLAIQAQMQKQDFRPELVDVLYPILERLGSNNAALQEHAMTCLNIVSNACEYSSSAALIVDNADYLVNAISLKLNTFDISPQVPQVLVMMIRLCGAPLIPFLDDLVESIFSILACFHGYPKLVESLFAVLNTIVEESSKSPVPLIEGNKDTTTRPKPYKPMTMTELAAFLRSRREAEQNRPLSPLPDSPPASSPPSKSTSPPPKSDNNVPDLDILPPADPPAPKPSKANTIITSITSLTPSHLTSPSPTLRTSLLHLLSISVPQLARDTDAFLPIAAQLYPYIATRLFASSTPAFELVAAAQAMSALCRCAGDFLRSRTDDDWAKLETLFRRVEGEMGEEVRAQRGRVGGMWWRAWDAVVELILGFVRDVGINEEDGAEDGVFEILGVYVGGAVMSEGLEGERERGKGKKDRQVTKQHFRHEDVMSLERREEVRETLEGLNADYLWLVQERGRVQRGGERLKKPDDVSGIHFHDLDY